MYVYKAVIDRVVDGDTYKLTVDLGFCIYHKLTVRLFGIDTPETYRPKSIAEKEHGEQATIFVKEAIEGKTVEVHTYKDRTDKYGRYLCEVFYPSEDDKYKNLAWELTNKGLLKRINY